MTTVAELAVALVLDAEDYTKGLNEAIKATDEVADSVKSTGKEVAGYSKEVDNATQKNKSLDQSLTAYMKRFDFAMTKTKDLGKALDFASGKSVEFEGDVKKAADAAKQLAKEQSLATKGGKAFLQGLSGMTKGLIGVTIAFAVGKTIKDFVSDSIAAAKAAGAASAEFSELAKQTARLKVGFGKNIVGEGGGLSFLARMAKGIADSFELADKSASQLAAVGITKERVTVFTEEAPVTGLESTKEVFKDMEGNILSSTEAMDLLGREIEDTNRAARLLGEATKGYREAFQDIDLSDAENASLIMEKIERDTRQSEQAAKDAQAAYNEFFRDLKEGLGGETLALLTGIEFEALGGDEIIATREAIKRAMEQVGGIDRETAKKFLGLQFAEEEGFKVIQGLQTAWQAAMNVFKSPTFTGTFEDAEKLVDAFLEGVDLINEADIEASLDASELISGNRIAQDLINKLNFIDNMEVSPDIDMGVDFDPLAGGGSGGSGFAHGADFIVPPGFPNDSFRLNVESGERVQVTPANQVRGGDRNLNIAEQNFFGIDMDEFASMQEDQEFME